MTVMRDPKTFCFNFEWPKCVEENLKYLIKFIIKMNESLVENKIKNKKNNEELLLKYKHGNNTHEHRKQQN